MGGHDTRRDIQLDPNIYGIGAVSSVVSIWIPLKPF
jgi:hypothetical protein